MNKFVFTILSILCLTSFSQAQEQLFTLADCIEYAIENSTDIRRTQNDVETQHAYLDQSKAARLPSLEGGLNQQFSSVNNYNSNSNEWERSNHSTLNASLSSQLTLYKGAKLKNTILQNQLNLEAATLNIQSEQEWISLNILSAYLDVLQAKETVRNSRLQYEAIQSQMVYTEARKEAGAISLADLLNFKSQQATTKASLTDATSKLRMALVNLMQLMNMPASDSFDIVQPDLSALLEGGAVQTSLNKVYEIALGIQPNIQVAKLDMESAEKGVSIAKALALPSLNLNTGISTGYGSGLSGIGFGEQLSHDINPYAGLSLSIPIFQQKQAKTQLKLAQIQTSNAELTLVDLKNNLRKYIEQACNDAQTAQSNFQAYEELFIAEKEAYQVALEMFTQGMMNAVDFLLAKNDLIMAENKFTQAKYTLILQNKIVEYYSGNPISL